MNSGPAKILDDVATRVSVYLSDWLGSWLGPWVNQTAIGEVTWAELLIFALCVIVLLVVHASAAYLFHRKKRSAARRPETKSWHPHLLDALGKPLYLLIWIVGIYVASAPLLTEYASTDHNQPLRKWVDKALQLGLLAAVFWALYRMARALEKWLIQWGERTPSKLDNIILPLIGRVARVVVPLAAVLLAVPVIGLPAQYTTAISRCSSILIIIAVAWILVQTVRAGEQALVARHDIGVADNLQARKLYTQVHVLSRTVYFIVAVFAIASILMVFPEVRRLGTSLLASAGLAGIVAGLAAQKTLSNLIAGFQIAMTQPIRLDDVLIVENEWGNVEEITLTYVVLKIWDERRLIVPLNYFIEKPFQNWTRMSSSLLGAVMIWADYTLPVDELRAAVKGIVEGSELWDQRFWNLQVSDATEHTMQLRVLATAADSSKAWDLRCEIREKLIAYIGAHYPQGLPQVRLSNLRDGRTEHAEGTPRGMIRGV